MSTSLSYSTTQKGKLYEELHKCLKSCHRLCLITLLCVCVPVPLPALGVSIGAQGNLLAGDMYSLTCTATELIDGLTNSPTLQWLNSSVSISSVTVDQAPARTLYTEDDLTLTCTIQLDEAVDTGVVVTVE